MSDPNSLRLNEETVERLARAMCAAWEEHQYELLPPLMAHEVLIRPYRWKDASEIWKFLARVAIAELARIC